MEDESTIAMLYEELLEAYGFVVAGIAKNGEEAVHKYKNFKMKPDVVIMDHRMPIKSGIEATEEIIEFDKSAKIIFASADKTVREIAILVGALVFKEKPFDNKTLIDDINKVLGK